MGDFMTRLKLQAQIYDFRDDSETKERVLEQFISVTKHTELQKHLLSRDKSSQVHKSWKEVARMKRRYLT